MVSLYESIIVVFVGLAAGSFVNVVVFRWPRQLSLIFPHSFCPACEKGIKFFDNVPVLSYILLRGKCRSCGAPISLRYPLVELACGALAYGLFRMLGMSIDLVSFFLFCTGLLALSLIDLETELIPDIITFPLAGLGLVFSFFSAEVEPLDSLLGMVTGAGFFLLISVAYKALRGREGLGGGDVKLLGAIGAFLGWQGLLPTVLIGSLSGLLVVMPLIALRFFRQLRRVPWPDSGGLLATVISISRTVIHTGLTVIKDADPLPFGPFLSLGAVVSLFLKLSLIL